MIRIPLSALLGLGLALLLPSPAAGDPHVDSKAWGRVSTTGPPAPAAPDAQREKLLLLEEIARGVRPFPGLVGSGPHSAPPLGSRLVPGTSRPLRGAELAAAQARIRAKMAAVPPAGTQRWFGPAGPLPPKPREVSTSVPLTGEALARSLEQERAKLAAPRLAPRTAAPPGGVRWAPPAVAPDKPDAGTPAPSLNPEQRAKLERAARPPQGSH